MSPGVENLPIRSLKAYDTSCQHSIGLGVTLWEGEYEGQHATWMRWCDEQGQVIPTGAERATREAERATRAEAELAQVRAELERLRQRQESEPQAE